VVTVPAGASIRDHTLFPETPDEFNELTDRLDHAPPRARPRGATGPDGRLLSLPVHRPVAGDPHWGHRPSAARGASRRQRLTS
jgi:hypothetical protein